ncbi:MAG TPA: tetratricopeptide repeat protein, partial [Bryobacteraceae bacterium]
MKFAAAILCISLTPLFADDQLGEHAQAAKAAEARHDYKTAIREYRALTKLVPDNPQLRTNLAIALYL